MVIPLKDRTELKNFMDWIGRGATKIKRATHHFDLKEENFLQIQEMVILTQRAAALMESLKPQAKEEDSTPENDSRRVLLHLEPSVNGEVPVQGG
jgi:hypothetical protein